MTATPKSELDARARKLQALLAQSDLDGALIVQNADLFYFAGTIQQAHLYIPREGKPLLLARKSFPRAQAESALERIAPLTSLRDLPRLFGDAGYAPPRRLGLELDVLPANTYLGYQQIFRACELRDASPLIRTVRAIKSPHELAAIRRAAKIGATTLRAMRALLVEGIREIELAGKLEAVARAAGHQGLIKFRAWNNEMFYGHLMAGRRAAMPSYLASPTGGAGTSPAFSQSASHRKIRCGEPVLFDYVFAAGGYLADQTRIFALGSLSPKLLRAHAAMLEIQAAVADAAQPGITGDALYALAVERAHQAGYAENFGGLGMDRVSFIGHGVGLELDEYPILAKGQTTPLAAGMVIAIEPKVSFAGIGTVGIENTFVVTARGGKRLTCGSDEIEIIEK